MRVESRRGQSVPLVVGAAQRRTLEEWSTREDAPALARRARIVLRASDGVPSARIARELGVSRPTVTLWRRRFQEGGLPAVARIKEGRGRPPSVPPRKVRKVLDAGQRPPPPGHTRWTVRATAAHADVSPDTVQRIWRDHGIRPMSSAPGRERDADEVSARSAPEGAPAASPSANVTCRMPVPFSSFVGRQRELAAVEDLLVRSRLVSLVGCPGIGKTRIALEAATRVRPEQAEPCFVELGPVGDPRLVAHGVAAALGVRERAGEEIVETLTTHLRQRPMLLVLDNCEHLVAACAQLAGALLSRCPQLTVLATSQEQLGVPGERVLRVPPLALPASGDDDALQSAEAVRLFCERASSQSDVFALTPETAGDVVEICRRLDGNPLAIELAAARTGTLTPAAILERLGQRFRLLTSGSRAGPRRHRTLEAAIAWSYELLPVRQQVLLRRLAVFAGEITLDAAQEVCGDGDLADDVFYPLAGLVERSLVVAEVAGSHARYRLLESIGEFARDRLAESGEAERVHARFAAWCTTLVEQAEPRLAGPAQQQWLARLESEHDNVVAAIRHCVAEERAERALRIAGAVSTFWRLRGYLRKGFDLLERCLSAGGPDVAAEVWVKASLGAGAIAAMLGDFRTALARGEDSLRGAEEVDDHAAAARALTLLGSVTMDQGRPTAAADLLEQAVILARKSEDDRCLADALARCGQVHMLQANHEAALPAFAECYDLARGLGDRQAETFALVGQGWAAMDQGDQATGEARIRQALELARALGDRFRIGEALIFLGELTRSRGDLAEARTLFGECEQLAVSIRAPLLEARSVGGLGRVELSRQRYDTAAALFDRGMAITGEFGLPYVRTRMLLGASACAYATGRYATAEALLAEALDHARGNSDRQGTATALFAMGGLAREAGGLDEAASLHTEALQMHAAADDTEAVARSLEGLAGVALDRRRPVLAARLFGAGAAAWRDAGGEERWPWDQQRRERDLAHLRDMLGAEARAAAWEEGASRSREDIVGYALRRTGGRRRAGGGPAGLTSAEVEVARLVVQGLTSREVAARLFVSPRTVDSHLGRVYRKLGIHSRQQLRELAEGLPELQLVGA